jgi:hypothetical protein
MKRQLLLASFVTAVMVRTATAAPTDGFVEVPYFHYIQSPYNLPLSDRYAVTDGTNHFWVNSTDQPFQQGNTTSPRTEMRIFNDYTNGVWQFEGDLYVPAGTTGAAVMQVFGGTSAATASQLRVYNGSLYRYTTPILASIYDRWIHVNVIHDADAHTVSIYLNGGFVRSDPDRGPATYYFKCGVYAQDNPSILMQSKWATIKVWRRAPKIVSIVKTGNEVVVHGARGTPGTSCYVLASANVATLLTNWTRIATNSFDSNGGFSFTDTLDATTPQRVYRLELP